MTNTATARFEVPFLLSFDAGRMVMGRGVNKAEAHRLAHKLRDPKFYTSRTKRAVNSLTVERGPKVVQHD